LLQKEETPNPQKTPPQDRLPFEASRRLFLQGERTLTFPRDEGIFSPLVCGRRRPNRRAAIFDVGGGLGSSLKRPASFLSNLINSSLYGPAIQFAITFPLLARGVRSCNPGSAQGFQEFAVAFLLSRRGSIFFMRALPQG